MEAHPELRFVRSRFPHAPAGSIESVSVLLPAREGMDEARSLGVRREVWRRSPPSLRVRGASHCRPASTRCVPAGRDPARSTGESRADPTKTRRSSSFPVREEFSPRWRELHPIPCAEQGAGTWSRVEPSMPAVLLNVSWRTVELPVERRDLGSCSTPPSAEQGTDHRARCARLASACGCFHGDRQCSCLLAPPADPEFGGAGNATEAYIDRSLVPVGRKPVLCTPCARRDDSFQHQ